MYKALFLSFFILLIGCIVSYYSGAASNDHTHLIKATYNYANGDYLSCIEESQKAIASTSSKDIFTNSWKLRDICRSYRRIEYQDLSKKYLEIKHQVWMGLQSYKNDIGIYPTQKEGLQALCDNPGYLSWSGPYLSSCHYVIENALLDLSLALKPRNRIYE